MTIDEDSAQVIVSLAPTHCVKNFFLYGIPRSIYLVPSIDLALGDGY